MDINVNVPNPYTQNPPNPYVGNVPNPYVNTEVASQKKASWNIGRPEVVYAVFLLFAGFLFWNGEVFGYHTGLGAFVFFMSMIAGTLLYFSVRKVKQNRASLFWLSAAVMGAVPFILYQANDLRGLFLLCEFGFCFLWVAASAKTQISGFILFDLLNQAVLIPFLNFGGLFWSLAHGFVGKKEGDPSRGRHILAAALGIVISLPILALVLSLLISADSAFETFIRNLEINFDWIKLSEYFIEFVLGIPVAFYLAGLVLGNAHRRNTERIKAEGISRGLSSARILPRIGIYAPLIFFIVTYVFFIAVMSSYLLTAFFGNLPEGFTYAEYARRGFFELCGVSAINLTLLAFSYLFVKRNSGECPKTLRIISLILSGLTILLIAAAMSKMILYIDAYGLSRLRVYTSVFMAFQLFVFVLIIIWHVRPFKFKMTMPMVIAGVVFLFALSFSNTDGVIANYNVGRYLSGDLKQVDVEMFYEMSDAVTPAMITLATAKNADKNMRSEADEFLRSRYGVYDDKNKREDVPIKAIKFGRTWNLQSAHTVKLAEAYFEEMKQ